MLLLPLLLLLLLLLTNAVRVAHIIGKATHSYSPPVISCSRLFSAHAAGPHTRSHSHGLSTSTLVAADGKSERTTRALAAAATSQTAVTRIERLRNAVDVLEHAGEAPRVVATPEVDIIHDHVTGRVDLPRHRTRAINSRRHAAAARRFDPRARAFAFRSRRTPYSAS